jgi:hypothetical protein
LSVALKFRGPHERDVTDHRSLDEFAAQTDDAEDDEAAVGDDSEAVDDAEGTSGADDESSSDDEAAVGDDGGPGDEPGGAVEPVVVDPATSTSRYDPEGVACAACGAEVGRLWVADDGAVCADCKPW